MPWICFDKSIEKNNQVWLASYGFDIFYCQCFSELLKSGKISIIPASKNVVLWKKVLMVYQPPCAITHGSQSHVFAINPLLRCQFGLQKRAESEQWVFLVKIHCAMYLIVGRSWWNTKGWAAYPSCLFTLSFSSHIYSLSLAGHAAFEPLTSIIRGYISARPLQGPSFCHFSDKK